jgi:drug/metabolite transporter (DMT)-like permease
MAALLALLAATAFAFGNVLQQKGTLEAPASGDDPHFFAQILKRPVWLAGGALQVSGWILQATALDRGSLVVVQSLTAMSLVIALPIGARLTNQQIDRRVILGAVAMIAGIVLFLSVGQPQKGVAHPSGAAWWSACISAAVLVFLLARVGRRHDGAVRALYFGCAAGVGFALQASVTKEFMSIFGGGLDAIVHSWTTYALVASAVVGFVLQQSALKTGVLAPAMASSNAVTLFGSVIFGITIFEERLSNGSNRLAPALIGLAVALVGVVLLAGTKPPRVAQPLPFSQQSQPPAPPPTLAT